MCCSERLKSLDFGVWTTISCFLFSLARRNVFSSPTKWLFSCTHTWPASRTSGERSGRWTLSTILSFHSSRIFRRFCSKVKTKFIIWHSYELPHLVRCENAFSWATDSSSFPLVCGVRMHECITRWMIIIQFETTHKAWNRSNEFYACKVLLITLSFIYVRCIASSRMSWTISNESQIWWNDTRDAVVYSILPARVPFGMTWSANETKVVIWKLIIIIYWLRSTTKHCERSFKGHWTEISN